MTDNMIKINLSQIQNLYTYFIPKLLEIFDEYDIKYCAIGGTALGAVRHSGFIPWDDDIDLGMLRDDYDRFLELADKINNEHPYFRIEHFSNTKYIDHALIRVLIRNTKRDTNNQFNQKLSQELYIDIFPFDFVPISQKNREKQQKELNKLRRQIYFKSKKKSTSFIKTIGLYLKKVFIFSKSLNKLCKKRDYIASKKYKEVDEGYVCSMMSQYSYDRQTFSLNIFGKLFTHQFETIYILIPEHFVEYLQQLYGMNYMTPIKRSCDDENRIAFVNSQIYDDVFIKSQSKH